ncbi:MAG: tetratricopeptide repeat protein [Elusimicrobiota bacterium]|jgi:tetratricopeptide (TPR) repeat protein|nr:tetratricopeptide repeat protein [Elusimicrobiota bacterium]
MKKIFLLPAFALAFTGAAFAQSPDAELGFYKQQAAGGDKKLLCAVADNLFYWSARNYALPAAPSALMLKADSELKIKAFPAAVITLLRYKYEYPKSNDKEALDAMFAQASQNIEKDKREALGKLTAAPVAAAPVEERLAAFLSEAAKLDLKNTFAPLFAEYQNFFTRFPVYGDKDRLELMLGDLYRQNKNYQAAIMQYQKVYEIYPSTKYKAASVRMTGDIYGGELKDYNKAMHYYETVLADFPDSAERGITYNHMAILSENKKDYSGAVNYITSAADIYIKDNQAARAYDALLYKADLQENRLKDYVAAADTLKKTADIFAKSQQKFVEVKLKTAGIYSKRLKDFYGQLAAYEAIITNYPAAPQTPQAMFDAAGIYEKLSNPQQAKAVYQKLIIAHPADALAIRAQKRVDAIDKQAEKAAQKASN